MIRHTVFLILLILAGPAAAQSQVQMPIPGFSYTYSYATSVRGFHFQCPVNFTVVGLRVPDETNYGKQNVALYALSAKPSNYTPTKSELLFYSTGQPSSRIIPCQVQFKAGQWFGVLGMCGDATTSHNSYGNGAFKSTIAGGPQVTLNRLYMNQNLVTSGGLGAMTATTGYIGRVQVYVKAQAFAKAENYGEGSSAIPVMGNVKLAQSTFSQTYSGPYSRGFFFRVPAPLTVTGWEVPDEAKNGKMNLALYRLASPPPQYPNTINARPIYYQGGATSGTPVILPTPFQFKTGEYLGVLGACGPTGSTLHNSYGATSPWQCTIGANQVSLERLIMQASIVSNQGAGGIQGHAGGLLGRVFLYIRDRTVPSMTTGALPVLGQVATLEMRANLKEGLAGGVIMGLGRLHLSTPLGVLLVQPPFVDVYPLPGGTGTFRLPIPQNPVLLGAGPIDFQGFVLTITNFGLTGGVEWYLGR